MKLSINGAELEVDDRHAKTPLLWVLRDVLGLQTWQRSAASVSLAPASLAAAEARRALEQAADSLAAEVPNGAARLPWR
jgi:isoquinoline 1-oxidoreductase beta subunit